MTIYRHKPDEKHLTEDSVETPAEHDAESYVGHMTDGEDDQVNEMTSEVGIYLDDEGVPPEVDIAGQVEKAEAARRNTPKEKALEGKD